MPGLSSESDYENELLASYRRKGRLPTVRKRDVNLALSIYKTPKFIGAGKTAPRGLVGDKLTSHILRRLTGRKPSDARLMSLASHVAITKFRANRAAAKKAKAAIRRRRRQL
jgi:hypothetical protein